MQAELTAEQKRAFVEQGFIKLPGAVSAELVARARRAINGYIGDKGIDPTELTKYRVQSYCPGLGGDPIITDLYNATPIRQIAESLIGSVRPVGGGQIALRFPSPDFAATPKVSGPHIDGMYSPTNGVKEGTIGNFTALVGVFLSDLPEPFAGNFAVWPGSHTLHEGYFRERGPQSLLEGMPPITLPTPEQFTGQAGDAVIAHYLLGHSIANNLSPNVRYAIFFRLTHTDHEQLKWESMTDAWVEWPGLHDVVSR